MTVKLRKVKGWEKLEAHPLAEEYPTLSAYDLGRIEEGMRMRGYDQRFPIVLWEAKILDGRSRHAAAKAAGIEPVFTEFKGSEEQARLFVQTANEERRHLALEWLQKRRQERVDRVAAARLNGESTRMIAEREGVSQTQVLSDLKAATEQGCSVQPDSGTVKSKDGKERPATRKRKPKEKQQEVEDSLGATVPPRLRDVFADDAVPSEAAKVREWMEAVKFEAVATAISRRAAAYPYLSTTKVKEHLEEAFDSLRAAAELIEQNLPYAVCPSCEGTGKQCKGCRCGCGYVPRWRFEELKLEQAS